MHNDITREQALTRARHFGLNSHRLKNSKIVCSYFSFSDLHHNFLISNVHQDWGRQE